MAADRDSIHCALARVHGRVQGVGFREACIAAARHLGVTGWVRNRMDDTVEALLQGTPAQLDAMQRWLAEGPPSAWVTQVDVQAVAPPFHRHETFERLPTA